VQKSVLQTHQGVKISFSGEVKKTQIIKMVENCTQGKCDCMSETTKKKIIDMKVDGTDGYVELSLSGKIEKEEIEKALKKSKLLN